MSDDKKPTVPPASKATGKVRIWPATPAGLHAGRKKGDREKEADKPVAPQSPAASLPKTVVEMKKRLIATRPKPYGKEFSLGPRVLADADWKWKELVAPPPGQHSGVEETRPLSYIFYYEFARECGVVRRWAKIEALQADEPPPARRGGKRGIEGVLMGPHEDACDEHPEHQAIDERLQRAPVYGLHPFLWGLRAELAADTPWLSIEPARREAALKVAPTSAPTMFAPWPGAVRPAFGAEVGQRKPLNMEGWTNDRRRAVEVIMMRVDWEGATETDLAKALEWWRPWKRVRKAPGIGAAGASSGKEFEWRKIAPEGPNDDGRGKGQGDKFRAYLRALAVLRLRHQRSDDLAFGDAVASGLRENGRKDYFHLDLKRAVEIFKETFYWIDGAGPLSEEPAAG